MGVFQPSSLQLGDAPWSPCVPGSVAVSYRRAGGRSWRPMRWRRDDRGSRRLAARQVRGRASAITPAALPTRFAVPPLGLREKACRMPSRRAFVGSIRRDSREPGRRRRKAPCRDPSNRRRVPASAARSAQVRERILYCCSPWRDFDSQARPSCSDGFFSSACRSESNDVPASSASDEPVCIRAGVDEFVADRLGPPSRIVFAVVSMQNPIGAACRRHSR